MSGLLFISDYFNALSKIEFISNKSEMFCTLTFMAKLYANIYFRP